MTRNPDNNTVSLSLASWAGVFISIVTTIAGVWFTMAGRVGALEVETAKQSVSGENQEKRLATVETKLEHQRDEWIQEIKDLRMELKRSQ